jgi:hypothetical protein
MSAHLSGPSIFGIGYLKTAATNNVLLVSTSKPTIINSGYCYQPIPIMNPRYYNKSFLAAAW